MTGDRPVTQQPPEWWPGRRLLILAVFADSVAAGVLVASGTGDLLRPVLVFVFIVLGPGLAVTGFLRLRDPVTELAIAIPLSLALDLAVAGVMTLSSAWRPDAGLVVSVLITVVALALQLRSSSQVIDGQG
jgi:hypothetical protein